MVVRDEEKNIPVGKIGFGIVIIILVAILLGGSIAVIDAGHRGVLLSFGKVEDRILGEGFNFIIPIQNSVVMMSVQTLKYTATASAASKDLQDVSAEVALNYRLDSTKINRLYQTLGLDYEARVIQPALQESVKASTAQFTAEELITKRPEVKERIEAALTERLAIHGILLETVSITNFQFSSGFTQAIEAKVVAVQNAQKAENVLKQIEIEARQRIAAAQGEANATVTKALAEAQAIQITGEALKNNPQLVQLEAVKKWDGIMPTMMLGSGALPFIDITGISTEGK